MLAPSRPFLLVLAAASLGFAARAAADYTQLSLPGRTDYAFDNNGVLYVTSGSDIVRYNTATSSYLPSFNVGGSLVGIDLSPDGSTLAVADASTQGTSNRVMLVNTGTGSASAVPFTRAFQEGGTFMVAWGSSGNLLVSSSFLGSGNVPLREYNPSTGVTLTLGSVRQDTMLTPSADRSIIGLAQANSSNGPVSAFDPVSHATLGSTALNWFTYEVAVNRNGTQFVVPTYNGAYVLNRNGASFTQTGLLGQYASHGPLSAAFAPNGNFFFTAEWSFGSEGFAGVRVYDANTLQPVATLDTYPFDWGGNQSMDDGRMEVSPDGRWLAVSVDGGVRLYDVSAFAVPEPGSLAAAGALGLAGLAGWRRRRRQS